MPPKVTGGLFEVKPQNMKDTFHLIMLPNQYQNNHGTLDIQRIEAEKKLLMPENEPGAFLMRDGDTFKHYRIQALLRLHGSLTTRFSK